MSNIIKVSNEGPVFFLQDPDTGTKVTLDGSVILERNFISIEPVEELFLANFPNKTKCEYVNKAEADLWALLDENCREDNWVQ